MSTSGKTFRLARTADYGSDSRSVISAALDHDGFALWLLVISQCMTSDPQNTCYEEDPASASDV